jgi:putative nucleotidyltransferase with HDIG domain
LSNLNGLVHAYVRRLPVFVTLISVAVTGVMFVIVTLVLYLGSMRIAGQQAELASRGVSDGVKRYLQQVMLTGATGDEIAQAASSMRAEMVEEDGFDVEVFRGQTTTAPGGQGEGKETQAALNRVRATGREVTSKDGDRLEYFYPIKATASCLACHTSALPGDLLGIVSVKHDAGPTLRADRRSLVIMLLCLFPLPALGAFVLARVFSRRLGRSVEAIRASTRAVNETSDLDAVNLGAISPGFVEFDALFTEVHRLTETLRAAAKHLHESLDLQTATNSIMKLALQELPLDELLARALAAVLSTPWLRLESRGAIFLVGPTPGVLIMKAQQGLSEPIKLACAQIPFGTCLCGRAAQDGEVLYASHLGAEHAITCPGIAGHGHYIVPLRVGDSTIGVLNTYVGDGHARDGREEQFLRASADVLTSIIVRRRAEERAAARMKQVAALNDIASAILAGPDMQGTLSLLVERVVRELHVDAAAVLLRRGDSEQLEFAAGTGFRTEALHYTRLRFGQGYAGRSAQERRVIAIPDLGRDPGELSRAPLLPREEFVSYLGVPMIAPEDESDSEEFRSFFGVPLLAKGQVKGVIEVFNRTPLHPDKEWLCFLESMADQAALAVDNVALFKGLQRSNIELQRSYDATLEGWVRALDMRDRETEGHTRRVTEMAECFARALGSSDADVLVVRRGALLHDIGKIVIPDAILHKPGPLDRDEGVVMRSHAERGYEFVASIDYLRPAADIPHYHHEKWDGSGYPRGLAGNAIPLAARLFAMVDVFDALVSERPYKPAWPREKAIEEIRSHAGTYFDPALVDVFLTSVCNTSVQCPGDPNR